MSATNIVDIRGQSALTNTLVISDACEITHKQAMALVRKYENELGEISLLAFETRPRLPGRHGGGDVEYALLTQDQATFLITMFRNTPKVVRFKLALVKAFRKALNEISRLYANPPRRDILKAKRAAHEQLTDALLETRTDAGKETKTHHYTNENRLCNYAVTGSFEKIDEKALSNADAELLESVRKMDGSLIQAGLDYDDRKKRLTDYAIRQRTKRLAAPAEVV